MGVLIAYHKYNGPEDKAHEMWLHVIHGKMQYFTARLNAHPAWGTLYFLFKILFILFLERGEGRDRERDRNISVWLPLLCPLLGTWPVTQVRALTGNRTFNPLVRRLVLNPLSRTSQGSLYFFFF